MHYFAPTLSYAEAERFFVFKDEGSGILSAPAATKCLQQVLGRLIDADDVQWTYYPAFGNAPMWTDKDGHADILCAVAIVPQSVYGQNMHSKDAVFFSTWN